jgi:hypothetical protein
VPKVHNKPIKRLRKGFKQKSKRQPGRHPGLAHQTVRCTRALEAELFTFGKRLRALRYNSPDCPVHTGLSGVPAEQRLLRHQRSPAEAFNALQCAPESEHAREAHQTAYRACPVHHRTARRPHQSELQRSNPNSRVTWLAHRTLSGGAPNCPVRPSTAASTNGQVWWLGL